MLTPDMIATPPLLGATPAHWAATALTDLPRFLQDHAACERKAAAQCMALVARYPERPGVVETMTAMAREELGHFLQVFRLMQRRGIALGADEPDPYVQALRGGLRHDMQYDLVDRLMAGAMIEARSAERLQLVAMAIDDEELQRFYRDLARTEAAHFRVFVDLAIREVGALVTEVALDRWRQIEDAAWRAVPARNAVH